MELYSFLLLEHLASQRREAKEDLIRVAKAVAKRIVLAAGISEPDEWIDLPRGYQAGRTEDWDDKWPNPDKDDPDKTLSWCLNTPINDHEGSPLAFPVHADQELAMRLAQDIREGFLEELAKDRMGEVKRQMDPVMAAIAVLREKTWNGKGAQ